MGGRFIIEILPPWWSSGTGGIVECGGCGGLLSLGGDDDRNEFDLTMLGVEGPPPTTPPAPFWNCQVYVLLTLQIHSKLIMMARFASGF